MNAYELADLIGLCGDGGYNQDAANMLRQQADRIAELEKPHKYDPETGEPLIDGYPLFSGLPRPQTKTENTWTSCSACGQKVTEDLIHTCSPQIKPLSDGEIDEVSKAIWERPWLEKHREFAKAIEERHGIK